MKRKSIGYFEGTDSIWLTSLTAQSCDTIPVSNGYDGHGKNVRLFNARDKVDAVIGYLHKVVAPKEWEVTTVDILHECITYDIPVLLVVPGKLHGKARKLLGKAAEHVQLVEPSEMLETVKEVLQ